jgi:hypothetical protein
MRRQQGVAGYVGAHRAITQDEMWQDGEDRFARRALDTPDSDPAQTDTDIMGVAGQAPAAATGRLVRKLEAQGQEKGEHAFDKRLAVTQELHVGRFIAEIDGDK